MGAAAKACYLAGAVRLVVEGIIIETKANEVSIWIGQRIWAQLP
jgi:hypothetical protein